MEKAILILIQMSMVITLIGQNLEVEGKVKVAVMDAATTAAQHVTREPTGILSVMSSSSPTYNIGDLAHGGIVFWVTPSGEHGRVANLYNVLGVEWSMLATSIGNSARSDINGAGNSVAIISQEGHTLSAAKQCIDLAFAGYDDWYLPSKNELNQMYINRLAINTTAMANGGEEFEELIYWSSTESDVDASEAWNQSFFGSGSANVDPKTNQFLVRSIRAF